MATTQVCLSSPARDLAGILLSLNPNYPTMETTSYNIPNYHPEKPDATCTSKAFNTPCINHISLNVSSHQTPHKGHPSQDIPTPSNTSSPVNIPPTSLSSNCANKSSPKTPCSSPLKNGFKSHPDLDQPNHQQVRAKKECVLKSYLLTEKDQLTIKESEPSKSEELVVRYWRALQANLACAGIDLQV